jgi:WD40 repeat protein
MFLASARSVPDEIEDPPGNGTNPAPSWESQFSIQLWNARSYEKVGTLTGHTKLIADLRFNHTGDRLASCGLDDAIFIWDVEARSALLRLPVRGRDLVCSVSFSFSGEQLLSRNGVGEIFRWDLGSQSIEQTYNKKGFGINPAFGSPFSEDEEAPLAFSACFCHNDAVVAGVAKGNQLMRWDTRSGRAFKPLCKHTQGIMALAVSHSGEFVATASHDSVIVVWNVVQGTVRKILRGQEDYFSSLCFNHDATSLVAGSDNGNAVIWNLETGTAQVTIRCNCHVYTVVFIEVDSLSRLAVGLGSNVTHIYDVTTGDRVATLDKCGCYLSCTIARVILM